MITPYVPLVLEKVWRKLEIPDTKNVSGTNLRRLIWGLSAKCADFWLSGRHVADMLATFPAKPRITPADAMVVDFGVKIELWHCEITFRS